jgi:hypothetical protein
MTQIWMAMCASSFGIHQIESFSESALNLFAKRGLIRLIKTESPPDDYQLIQETLW